ncbi:hypothetical protein JTE90_001230 [Oedothorax gibbosus]|uniref:Uncharacterized protein n=1 Tax=Oedothorax gibbosus TaxID=931172 RepID=A0AAV6UU52_9ARAC|nr:hypothetical protein JTE90_001230 [Oedothorax gibbosus]
MVLSMNGLLLVVVTVASISIAQYCPDKCHCPIFYPHDTEPVNSPVQEYPRPQHPKPEYPKPEYPRPEHPRPEHPRPGHPRPIPPRPEHPRPIPPRPEHPRPIPPRPEHPRPQYPGNTNTDVKNQNNCNNQQTGSGLIVIGIQGLLDPCINTQ